jgi:DNA-binding NarL/FixJ family response regulator
VCAGASGCLLKKTPPAVLLEQLRAAAPGGVPMLPEVARRTLGLLRVASTGDRELLELLARGHNYETAAVELGISVSAAAARMKRVYAELHARLRHAVSA